MLFPRTEDPLQGGRGAARSTSGLVDAALSTLDDSLAKRLPHIVVQRVSCETVVSYAQASPEALLSASLYFGIPRSSIM